MWETFLNNGNGVSAFQQFIILIFSASSWFGDPVTFPLVAYRLAVSLHFWIFTLSCFQLQQAPMALNTDTSTNWERFKHIITNNFNRPWITLMKDSYFSYAQCWSILKTQKKFKPCFTFTTFQHWILVLED